MKHQNQHFFYFTRRERNGALVLITICLTVYLLPEWFHRMWTPPPVDFSAFQSALVKIKEESRKTEVNIAKRTSSLFYFDPNLAPADTLLALGLPPRTTRNIINYRKKGGRFHRREDLKKIYTLQSQDYERLAPYVRIEGYAAAESAPTKKEKATLSLFPFNPNEVSEEELQRLGLSDRAAATFIRYREKGGQFQKPEDIGKVYGVTTTDVERLRPYVELPQKKDMPGYKTAAVKVSHEKRSASVVIDINQADAETWRQLYGVGPVLSERIVRFREKLGGFTHVEQVGETYGLPDSTFQRLRSRLIVSPIERPLAINRLDEKRLSEHPYINYRLARAIVAYRLQHGPFQSVEDLEKMHAMPDTVRQKLQPYCTFN